MWIAIVVIVMALTHGPWPIATVQGGECPGVTVVRNGLAAFAAGVERIGPYTDAATYLEAGLEYIALRCRTE